MGIPVGRFLVKDDKGGNKVQLVSRLLSTYPHFINFKFLSVFLYLHHIAFIYTNIYRFLINFFVRVSKYILQNDDTYLKTNVFQVQKKTDVNGDRFYSKTLF